MQYYFNLQFRLFNRQIKDFGLSPLTAYLIVIPLFAVFSYYAIPKHPYIPYAYAILGFFASSMLAGVSRNTFLKYCYPTKTYYLIRFIENQLTVLAFSVFLLIHQYVLLVAIIQALAALSIFIPFKNSFSFTIPTPFSKYPFEFTSGFRGTFYMIILAYFCTYMSIQVDNYNLCFVCLLLIYLTTLSYYFLPEAEYYVWTFAMNAQSFLWYKIKTALWLAMLLSLPIIVSALFFFPQYSIFTITALLCGSMYLTLFIITKYLSYPHPLGLPYLLTIGFSILFPPIALGLIFIYYPKAIQRLQHYLK